MARRDPGSNFFHLDGELLIAPKELFSRMLKDYLPLLKAQKNLQKILLSLLPRYWRNKG